MTTLDTVATRSANTNSIPDGKAYFETSTNQFIVWDATDGEWIQLDSDGTGAARYNLDLNYSIDTASAPLLHLDASDLSLSDGDSVTTWSDKSGNGYNFSGTGTTAPIFKTSGRLGHNTVLFDGTDDFMSNGSVLGQFTDEDATLIAVFNQYDTDSQVDIFDTGSYSGGDRLSPDYTSAFLSSRILDVAQNFAKPTANNNIFGLRINSATPSYKLYFNNSIQYEMGNHSFGVTSTMSIGGGNTSYKFNGEISEILLFNKVLSDADWDTVHAYLSAKYLASSKTVLSGSYSLDSTYSVTTSPTFHFSPESTYLFKSDGTQASANDDSVLAWKDKSRGLFVAADQSALSPVLKTNHINGNNALYFNGDVLSGAATTMLENYNGGGTLIFAFDANGDTQADPISLPATSNARLINDGSTGYMSTLRSSRLSGQYHGVDINNPHITTITTSTSSNYYKIFGNGGSPVTNVNANAVNYSSISATSDILIGSASAAGTAYPLNGYIYEILFFDSALSDADLNAVGNYLGAKYGISYTAV
jgi:hypothetical protein